MRKKAMPTARGRCSRLGLVPLMLFSSLGTWGLSPSKSSVERQIDRLVRAVLYAGAGGTRRRQQQQQWSQGCDHPRGRDGQDGPVSQGKACGEKKAGTGKGAAVSAVATRGRCADSPNTLIFTLGPMVNWGRVGTGFSPECDAAGWGAGGERGGESQGMDPSPCYSWEANPCRLCPPPPSRGSQGSPKAGRRGCGHGWKPTTLLTGGAADEHLHPQTLPVQIVSGRGWGGDWA